MPTSRHRIARIIAAAMALAPAALSATAQAQPQLAVPTGITTDRISPDPVAVAIDLGFMNFDDGDGISYGMRADFYAQLLADLDTYRVGGYAALPFARMAFDDDDPDAINKLGALELGGLFSTAVGATTDGVLRAGVATGLDDEEPELGELVVGAITSYGRPSEIFLGLPETTWLRLSGSLLHRSHPYIVRADLGVDIPFREGDDDTVFARANLAAGVDLDAVALMAELSNVLNLDSDEGDEQFLSALAFTAHVPMGTVAGCLGVSIPLDDALQDFVDFVVVAGVRVTSEL